MKMQELLFYFIKKRKEKNVQKQLFYLFSILLIPTSLFRNAELKNLF